MRTDASCLYTLLHAPRETHEQLLREFVIPVVREVRAAPELDSLFFARYSVPDWQLRFRVLGRPEWVEGAVKRHIDDALASLRRSGLVEEVEFARYQREWERYGGEDGMLLAERIFLHDSLAALAWIDAESRGAVAKTRREYSLLYVEKFLDLMGFDREARIAYYEFASSWPIREGEWGDGDLKTLDAKFEELAPGLQELLEADTEADAWGGAEPARIARDCLEATRPVIETLRARYRDGRISQGLVSLAWSYTHMHCNRLGIDSVPEAILRYFMWRFYTRQGAGAH